MKVDSSASYYKYGAIPCLQVYTADAKLGFDDNAQFRQRSIFDMEDTTESDPREVEAASFNLNYVQVRRCHACRKEYFLP